MYTYVLYIYIHMIYLYLFSIYLHVFACLYTAEARCDVVDRGQRSPLHWAAETGQEAGLGVRGSWSERPEVGIVDPGFIGQPVYYLHKYMFEAICLLVLALGNRIIPWLLRWCRISSIHSREVGAPPKVV